MMLQVWHICIWGVSPIFFSADPLKLCQVGWRVPLYSYFQVSPEIFVQVQVRPLAGPLKDIQRLVPKPLLRWLGCVLKVVLLLEGEPPGCVRAIWPRRKVMECCIRWPGLHKSPDLNPIEMVWDELARRGRKSSQQVLSKCGNSFKTVGKAFLTKLVERMPKVCKAVIKAKGGYFEESQM